jgi:hypothetical protein
MKTKSKMAGRETGKIAAETTGRSVSMRRIRLLPLREWVDQGFELAIARRGYGGRFSAFVLGVL